ncbi:MAG: putative secreted protein [Ferruginibacter sp.]|nr:putative secreted protein [Ferruginibacter sp.]
MADSTVFGTIFILLGNMETKIIHTDDQFDITLKGKGTAGYTWKYTLTQENIVSLAQKKNQKKVTSPPQAGASFDEIFTVTALKKGEVTLHFYLARGWEPDSKAPVEERDIKVMVE